MKSFILTMLFSLLAFTAFTQEVVPKDQTESKTVLIATSTDGEADTIYRIPLEDLANQLVQAITQSGETIKLPTEKIDAEDETTWMEWFKLLYGLAIPLISFIYFAFFPAKSRKYVTAISTGIAILIIAIVITSQGVSFESITGGLITFVMQIIAYTKVYKPYGLLVSRKADNYER